MVYLSGADLLVLSWERICKTSIAVDVILKCCIWLCVVLTCTVTGVLRKSCCSVTSVFSQKLSDTS